MNATEHNFPAVLFIMLYKVVQAFKSMDEVLKCDCSNESYWAQLSCGTVYYVLQGGSNFGVCEWNPKVFLIQMKDLEQFLPVKLFTLLYKKFQIATIAKKASEKYFPVVKDMKTAKSGCLFWVSKRKPEMWPYKRKPR